MKEYYDILNRRKPMEDVGDAFKGQADAMRPMNVGQRREQALMRGFGAGINMGARAVDEAKIREIEEDSRQMAMLTKELTMATGKNQVREQKIKSFIADQDSNLKLASDLIVKGKYDQLDILAPSIFNAYKEHTGTNLGEYLFSKNGHISFKTPDGKIETMEAKTLFNPIMNYIPPEDRGNYKGFATSYQAEELDAIVETRRLKNELLQSQADNAKAHSNLYEAQAKEALRKAENPVMSDIQKLDYKSQLDQQGELQKSRLKVNNDYLEALSKENTKASNILPILDEFDTLLKDNPDLFGSSKWAEAKRAIAKFTGDDASIQRANYLQKYFFPEIKGIAGNPNQREWSDLIGKIISESQNIEAAKAQIKLDRQILQGKQREFNNYSQVLSMDNNISSKYYYDPEISAKIKAMNKQNDEEVILPNGTVYK